MVKNMEKGILAIGMATKDFIITPDCEYYQIGGAVFYQTATLNQLNSNVKSIISIGKEDVKLLDNISCDIILTDESMQYTNIYDKNFNRIQKATLPKNPIKPEHITTNLDNISDVLISPLSPYDIPPEIISYFKEKEIRTILTPQGYLRTTDKHNNVIEREWEDIDLYLEHTDIICLDENEAKKAFKLKEIKDRTIIDKLCEYNLEQIIITRAEKGSKIYTKNKMYEIPVIKTDTPLDATGLGDTYIAAYIHKLEECDDIYLSGVFASITAKEKLKQHGPLKTSKEKIEKELDKYR